MIIEFPFKNLNLSLYHLNLLQFMVSLSIDHLVLFLHDAIVLLQEGLLNLLLLVYKLPNAILLFEHIVNNILSCFFIVATFKEALFFIEITLTFSQQTHLKLQLNPLLFLDHQSLIVLFFSPLDMLLFAVYLLG